MSDLAHATEHTIKKRRSVRSCKPDEMELEILGEIRDIETNATGRNVCIGRYLEHTYGKGRWRKMEGIATMRLADGAICEAEIHRFDAHGIGCRDFKTKNVIR